MQREQKHTPWQLVLGRCHSNFWGRNCSTAWCIGSWACLHRSSTSSCLGWSSSWPVSAGAAPDKGPSWPETLHWQWKSSAWRGRSCESSYLVLLAVVAELILFEFHEAFAGRALPVLPPLLLLILLLISFRNRGRKHLVLLALPEEPGEAGRYWVRQLPLSQWHVLSQVVEASQHFVRDPHVLQPQARV